MPTTLFKYLFKELGRSLMPPLLIFTFFLLPFILGAMLRQGVDVLTLIQVAPMVFPYGSGYILPLTMLTGAVMCYSRMSNDREYQATQAAGIWPGWIVAPSIAAGFIATLMTLYLNDDVLTSSTERATELLIGGQVQSTERALSRRGVVQLGNYHLYRFARDAKDKQALDATIYSSPSGKGEGRYPKVEMRIIAQDHSVTVERDTTDKGKSRQIVVLHLSNSHTEDANGNIAEAASIDLPLAFDRDTSEIVSSNRVACWGISKLIGELRNVRDKMLAMPPEEAEGAKKGEADGYRKSERKYMGELSSRLALSFSCLVFALVGPLLGLMMPHGDWGSRFGAGMAVAGGYFVMFICCRSLVDKFSFAVWLPLVTVVIICAFLWRRMIWKR